MTVVGLIDAARFIQRAKHLPALRFTGEGMIGGPGAEVWARELAQLPGAQMRKNGAGDLVVTIRMGERPDAIVATITALVGPPITSVMSNADMEIL